MSGAVLFIVGLAGGWIARGLLTEVLHGLVVRAVTSAIGKEKLAEALTKMRASGRLQ